MVGFLLDTRDKTKIRVGNATQESPLMFNLTLLSLAAIFITLYAMPPSIYEIPPSNFAHHHPTLISATSIYQPINRQLSVPLT